MQADDTQHVMPLIICDRIWGKPAYGICVYMAKRILVPWVKICQSPVFVVFYVKEPFY